MKNSLKIKYLFLLVSCSIVFNACSKEEEAAILNNANANITVGLVGFDNTSGVAFKSSKAEIIRTGTTLVIKGTEDGGTRYLSITLKNVLAIGRFDISKGNTNGNFATISKDASKPTDGTLNYTSDAVSATGNVGGGSIIINKFTSTEIEATFFIIGYNSSKMEAYAENGKFSGTIKII